MHLWIRNRGPAWQPAPLETSPLGLYLKDGEPLVTDCKKSFRYVARLIRCPEGAVERWALLTSTLSVYVNSERVSLGIRLLRDRDEIRVEGLEPMYFSTERLASIEPVPRLTQAIHCPRCKQEITPGTDSVQCQNCGVWHHQTDDLPRWIYSERCALCDQMTGLEAGYRWTPEEL